MDLLALVFHLSKADGFLMSPIQAGFLLFCATAWLFFFLLTSLHTMQESAEAAVLIYYLCMIVWRAVFT